jgi:hypothetical protein
VEYLEIAWRPDGDEAAEPDLGRDAALAQVARIRELMEGTATYPVLSGASALVAGVVALAACAATRAVLARVPGASPLAVEPVDARSLGPLAAIWGAACAAAVALEVLLTKRAARGARSRSFYFPKGSPLLRRMRLAYTAPLFVGAVMTAGLARAGAFAAIPAAWLLSYGAALVCAGLFSTAPVRVLGAAFLAAGAAATAFPAGDLGFLALAFGGAHIAYGILVITKEGGDDR